MPTGKQQQTDKYVLERLEHLVYVSDFEFFGK
jgi:hypothetical protein